MNRVHCRLFVCVCLLIGLAVTAPGTFAQKGQWQTLPYTMPINPVHTALLYNGKVLIVSGSGNVAGNKNFKASLLVPQAATITTPPAARDNVCYGIGRRPRWRAVR